MREEMMSDIDWRTVQLFIGEEGVSEVSLDVENSRRVRCTCSMFSTMARCKHVKYVKKKVADNNGNYSVYIPEDVEDEEAIEALSNAESFRQFVLDYGKIEVL